VTVEKAQAVAAVLQSPGWAVIVEMLEQMRDAEFDRLEGMMNRPETLTGKAAIRSAARRRALKDFREEVEDAIKILKPLTSDGGDSSSDRAAIGLTPGE